MTPQQKSLKLLVIGDVCLDETVVLESGKPNPENNSPLYKELEVVTRQGMASNVVSCLKNLGFENIVFKKPSYPYSVKRRFMLDNSMIMRIDHDVVSEPAWFTDIDFSEFDAVVISDYNKGFVTDKTIEEVCKHFFGYGPVFLDTKKTNLKKFSGCIIKINQQECLAATSLPEDFVIVTLGANGATFKGYHYPALPVNCVDVCGAGDAFLAGMVWGWSHNTNRYLPNQYMIYAGICNASISVEYPGCYAPTTTQLENALKTYYEDKTIRNR